MEIIDILEILISIFFIGFIIFKFTKSFGLKGFLGTIAAFALLIFIITGFDKIMDWMYYNAPWMIIAFLLLMAVLIICLTFSELKKSYKKDPEKTKKYIIEQVKSVVILIGISILIMGIIFFVAFSNA